MLTHNGDFCTVKQKRSCSKPILPYKVLPYFGKFQKIDNMPLTKKGGCVIVILYSVGECEFFTNHFYVNYSTTPAERLSSILANYATTDPGVLKT